MWIGVADAVVLTAATVDLITWWKEIFGKCNSPSRGALGAAIEREDIESVSKSLGNLVRRIESHQHRCPRARKADFHLVELGLGTTGAIEPLSQALYELRVDHDVWGVFDSVRLATSTVFGNSELEELEARLDRYQQQIEAALPASLEDFVQYGQGSDLRAGRTVRSAQDIVTQQLQLYYGYPRRLEPQNYRLSGDFHIMAAEIMTTTVPHRGRCLDSFYINGLRSRLRFNRSTTQSLPTSPNFGNTFEWIFSELSQQVCPMALRSDCDIFWITGKIGSGKSKAVSYLSRDFRTAEHVRKWAVRTALKARGEDWVNFMDDDIQLRKASFFCDNWGRKLQMSNLLRGLISQLLEAEYLVPRDAAGSIWCEKGDETDFSMVRKMFPKRCRRYEMYRNDAGRFQLSELKAALDAMLDRKDRYYLFFIDALEGFDEDRSKIASLVMSIARRPNVKICAASRPHPTFAAAFSGQPSLRMEDSTENDVEIYVNGKLNTSPAFVACMNDANSRYDALELVSTLKERTSGCFAWLSLATDAVIEGMEKGEGRGEIRDRIKTVPPQLESLYNKTLDRLTLEQSKSAAQIFQLLQTYPDESTLLTLFNCQKSLKKALEKPFQPIKSALFCREEAERQLSSICGGLLEVPAAETDGWDPIEYSHSSIKQYVAERLPHFESKSPDFNPAAALAISYLLLAKSVEFAERDYKTARVLLTKAIVKIGASRCSESEKFDFLAEVERTGEAIMEAIFQESGSDSDSEDHEVPHWGDQLFEGQRTTKLHTVPKWWIGSAPTSMFDIAFAAGQGWYVTKCLEHDPSLATRSINSQYPLIIATKLRYWDIVRALLELGADPNYVENEWSAWRRLLHAADIRKSHDASARREYMQLLTLFLQHGADLSTSTELYSARYVMNEIIYMALMRKDADATAAAETLKAAVESNRLARPQSTPIVDFGPKLIKFKPPLEAYAIET